MVGISVEVDVSGPVFDERGQEALDRFVLRAEDDIAQEGVRIVRELLGEVLKHPTGYYSSRVMWARKASFAQVIGDNVIYGAWLEGVGSRNSPVTRFAGYFTFRRATTRLQGRVREVVERSALPQLLRELEG